MSYNIVARSIWDKVFYKDGKCKICGRSRGCHRSDGWPMLSQFEDMNMNGSMVGDPTFDADSICIAELVERGQFIAHSSTDDSDEFAAANSIEEVEALAVKEVIRRGYASSINIDQYVDVKFTMRAYFDKSSKDRMLNTARRAEQDARERMCISACNDIKKIANDLKPDALDRRINELVAKYPKFADTILAQFGRGQKKDDAT